jgi:hypothetical protein
VRLGLHVKLKMGKDDVDLIFLMHWMLCEIQSQEVLKM